MKRETIIQKIIKKVGNPNMDEYRNFLITIKSYTKFVRDLDRHWKKKGYKSRSRYLLHLAARDMKYKKPY